MNLLRGMIYKIKKNYMKNLPTFEAFINEREDKVVGGRGDKLEAKDVDKNELAVGVAVEMEHTDDSKTAEEIALDHLEEDPKYYSKLVKSGIVDEPEAIKLAKELLNIEPPVISVDDNLNEAISIGGYKEDKTASKNAKKMVGDGKEPNTYWVTISNYMKVGYGDEKDDTLAPGQKKPISATIFETEDVNELNDFLNDIDLDEDLKNGPSMIDVEDRLQGTIYMKFIRQISSYEEDEFNDSNGIIK